MYGHDKGGRVRRRKKVEDKLARRSRSKYTRERNGEVEKEREKLCGGETRCLGCDKLFFSSDKRSIRFCSTCRQSKDSNNMETIHM